MAHDHPRVKTAGLLTFVTYFLALHPNVLQRLREEILSHVGTSRDPNVEDIREMKYLRAVLNGKQNLSVLLSSSPNTNQKP